MLAEARNRVVSFVRELFGSDEPDDDNSQNDVSKEAAVAAAAAKNAIVGSDIEILTTSDTATTNTTGTDASVAPKRPAAVRLDADGVFSSNSSTNSEATCTSEDDLNRRLRHYANLLAKDDVIRQFLQDDSCVRLADCTLLAIAFVYFVRCRLGLSEYNRGNFFACLWLAHETEEEYDNLRLSLLPAWLGRRWTRLLNHAGQARTELWRRMRYRTLVTRAQLAPILARIERQWPHLARRKRPASPGPHPLTLRHNRQPSFNAGIESGPNCVWCRRDQRLNSRKRRQAPDRQEADGQQPRTNIRRRPSRCPTIIDGASPAESKAEQQLLSEISSPKRQRRTSRRAAR